MKAVSLLMFVCVFFSGVAHSEDDQQGFDFESIYTTYFEGPQWGYRHERECQNALKEFTIRHLDDFIMTEACGWVRGRGLVFEAYVKGQKVSFEFPSAADQKCYQTMASHIEIYAQNSLRLNLYRFCQPMEGERGRRIKIFQTQTEDQL